MTTLGRNARQIIYDVSVNPRPPPRPTPQGILVAVAFLALYCAFSVWHGVTYRQWPMLAIALLAAIACVAAASMLRWSRFLVFALSIGLAATWLYSIYAAARVGYFGPISWHSIIVSLMPDAAMLIVAAFCSLMVQRHFGTPPAS
jgi:hypothetical protein